MQAIRAMSPITDISPAERIKGVRILAKSIFKELTAQGYDAKQIVSLATELISEVTATLSAANAQTSSE
jgi:hypothetical protein